MVVLQRHKNRLKQLLSTGNRAEALRTLRLVAALDSVDVATAGKLAEFLISDDLLGRVVIAIPMENANVGVIGKSLKDAVADPQFDALSTHLERTESLEAWVRGFCNIWEEKLQEVGLTPTAGQVSKVLQQLLSAMLEV